MQLTIIVMTLQQLRFAHSKLLTTNLSIIREDRKMIRKIYLIDEQYRQDAVDKHNLLVNWFNANISKLRAIAKDARIIGPNGAHKLSKKDREKFQGVCKTYPHHTWIEVSDYSGDQWLKISAPYQKGPSTGSNLEFSIYLHDAHDSCQDHKFTTILPLLILKQLNDKILHHHVLYNKLYDLETKYNKLETELDNFKR